MGEVKRSRFNLVIEVLLISSFIRPIELTAADMFQSRNRGSFDFKKLRLDDDTELLIEFQSRNRGSFDFKPTGFHAHTFTHTHVSIS